MNLLNDTIKKLVKDFNIKSDNENGQNFLVDEEILKREIAEAELENSDVVLDIGAGFGSIEIEARNICKVIAIEKEIKCYSYLVDKYEIDPNVQIINADALDIIYPKFTKIISNPPYNIADRIIEKLASYSFKSGVMILPKTIAEQLCEKDNKTAFSSVQKIFIEFSDIMPVPKEVFYPEPRVTSLMVRLKKKDNDILQEIFRRREMTLKNAIINALIAVEKKTKRQGKESFSEIGDEIKNMENVQVKGMNLEEIKKVIDYFK